MHDLTEHAIRSAAGQTISDVERETGVAKETLRVWERRYGFPVPARDAQGQRVYMREDVVKLRLIKRVIDLGYRPGKVLGLGLSQLDALANACDMPRQSSTNRAHESQLMACFSLCSSHRAEDLRFKLSELMLQMGMYRFVVDILGPLNVMVGNAWAAGKIAVFEEHLYTESVQVVMRQAIAGIPVKRDREIAPRLLLTTLPQERHGLGLLMVEAVAALEGAACMSLGVQTPVADIVNAAHMHRADIVALSFSSTMRANQVRDGLRELRACLPASIAIWAGGSAAALALRAPESAAVMELGDIAAALSAWRLHRHPC